MGTREGGGGLGFFPVRRRVEDGAAELCAGDWHCPVLLPVDHEWVFGLNNVMSHRNVAHVSIHWAEVACYRPERTPMGCAVPPILGGLGVLQSVFPLVDQKQRSGWGCGSGGRGGGRGGGW